MASFDPLLRSPAAMAAPTPPHLPFELYRPIIEYFADSYDSYYTRTCILLRVCRTFRTETERIMYTKPNVPHGRILFFSKTILSRPDLGALIRKLNFTAAAHRPKQPGDSELVSAMLKLLPNLTNLAISEGPFDKNVYKTEDWVVGKDDSWIFDGCPFILERYRCHFSWGQGLVDFLSTQPHLREFIHVGGAPDNADHVPTLPEKTLAKCDSLAVPAHTLWGMKVPYTAITHLKLKIWDLSVVDAYAAARSIAPLGGTLKCLCLSRLTGSVDDEFPSVSSMIKLFAPSTPHLRYLAIYDECDFVSLCFPSLISRHHADRHFVCSSSPAETTSVSRTLSDKTSTSWKSSSGRHYVVHAMTTETTLRQTPASPWTPTTTRTVSTRRNVTLRL